MSQRAWHREGNAAIPGNPILGFARALPARVDRDPPRKRYDPEGQRGTLFAGHEATVWQWRFEPNRPRWDPESTR